MRAATLLFAAALCGWPLLSSCSQLVRYTDEIVDRRTGRSLFVTAPATVGGFCGFIAGLPADLAALPVTLGIYHIQKGQDKVRADPVSTMLFPSFVLWRAGTLVALPFDALHFAVVRAWSDPPTATVEEQNEIEYGFDLDTLPTYPVTPLYPLPGDDG